MGALCAVEGISCFVCARAWCIGCWIVDFGGFAIGACVDTVPAREDEGGGGGQKDVAVRGQL